MFTGIIESIDIVVSLKKEGSNLNISCNVKNYKTDLILLNN